MMDLLQAGNMWLYQGEQMHEYLILESRARNPFVFNNKPSPYSVY